ncbi:MAG: diguanylate cyclase [Mariprofundaceae bacterium]
MPSTLTHEIPANVLLVDEQKLVHIGMQKLLADAGDIELHSCYEGTQAIAMAEHLGPTVILQDINMPDVNGLDLLHEYQRSPAIANIPVLMLSGTESVETKAEAFARGASDYLVKMPHKIELIARIRSHSRAYTDHLEREAALKALEQERRKLAEAYRELELLSSLDGLTNIANRRFFDETFSKEWQRAMRATEPLSLIMVDVDFFKPYNDTYGHQAGDECLKLVAKALKDVLHRPTDLVARYGGEEFVVLLPGTHAAGAAGIGEQLRCAVHDLGLPHEGSTVDDVVTISLGVATAVPMLKHQPEALLKVADEALYSAKNKGRNRVMCGVL